MIRYECDRCGAKMGANDPARFIVRMEIYAATGSLELPEGATDNGKGELEAVLRHLATANPDDIEDQTYRGLRFDVCDACRRALLERPLG